MPTTNKMVYEVFEAVNGYFAQLPSGKVVVGKTLNDVTTEANALVTEEMTSATTPAPESPMTKWQKGLIVEAMKPSKLAKFMR